MDTLTNFLNKISKYEILKENEETELIKRAQNGDNGAKEKIFNHNLKLVVSVAKRFNKYVEMMDLVQEGSIGLYEAIEKFDENKGCKFSTYAYYQILLRVSKEGYLKSNEIRLPLYLVSLLPRVIKAREELLETHHNPTYEQIANKIGVKPSKVKSVLKNQNKLKLLSLDYVNEEENSFIDMFVQDTFEEPEKELESKEYEEERKKAINEALKTFSMKNRQVIIYRFGLDGFGRQRTLNEVSKLVGLSEERVRRILSSTLEMLGNGGGYTDRRKKIREYANIG